MLGALAASGYLLIGRGLRSSLSLLAYVWLTYSFAAVALIIAALAGGETFRGVSSSAWLLIAALAIGPQLLGHTSFNWALRRLTATVVAVSILGEPIGSALLARWLLDENFVPLQLTGFVVLLAGIFVAARAERIGSG
jgi:drug/metabolite transporter (DMT)-like permease